MDTGDIFQLIFLVILLLLSAFFSSAETALITVNRIRMRTLAEDGNKKAERVLQITDNSGKMLSAILIGNNIVSLSASSIATSLAIEFFGSVGAGIKAQHITAQFHHSSRKAKTGTGRGFKEQGRQFLTFAGFSIFTGVFNDIASSVQQFVDFLNRKISNIDQASHYFAPFTFR